MLLSHLCVLLRISSHPPKLYSTPAFILFILPPTLRMLWLANTLSTLAMLAKLCWVANSSRISLSFPHLIVTVPTLICLALLFYYLHSTGAYVLHSPLPTISPCFLLPVSLLTLTRFYPPVDTHRLFSLFVPEDLKLINTHFHFIRNKMSAFRSYILLHDPNIVFAPETCLCDSVFDYEIGIDRFN